MEHMACPECMSTNLKKIGSVWCGRNRLQNYRCDSCGRCTVYPINEEGAKCKKTMATIPSK